MKSTNKITLEEFEKRLIFLTQDIKSILVSRKLSAEEFDKLEEIAKTNSVRIIEEKDIIGALPEQSFEESGVGYALKDIEIPINIKNYKNSKSIKMYFKANVLNITKPTRLSDKRMMGILKLEEDELYNKYKKIMSSEVKSVKQWENEEKIFYKGKEFDIVREYTKNLEINVKIEEENKRFIIIVPKNIDQEVIKRSVDKVVKKILKKNTEILIAKRLPYWAEITGLKYNEVKIRDAITRYGSCMPNKRNLYFSSRLIMLPMDKVDAIIVHELCHIKYKYHNNDFYNLAEKYISNYIEIDKWLKKNGDNILF